MKNLQLFLVFFLIAPIVKAQDFLYGKVTEQEVEMKKYNKDTSAHAVVLNEWGTSKINETRKEQIRLIYEYHVKIKIFDNKGFDKGNVEIPLYNTDNEVYEETDNISGITFYKDDNGAVESVELDPKKTYIVKDNKHWSTIKFALPGLHKGCVIEYRYTVTSPYIDNFRPWKFQGNIPKVYSEYDAHIPAFWAYNASLRGNLKLSKNKSEVERDCVSFRGAKADCSSMVYAISDVPAFIEEDYMTSPNNFKSAIYFELSEYTDWNTGAKIKVTKEWRDVDYQLKLETSFGSQLKKNSLFKERLVPVLAGKINDLDKAKAVYTYLQKWFKWNDFIGYSSVDGIRNALENHSGSVADINLSLVTALNAAGLNAEAVLLSTREHGVVNALYPVLGDFNYVIAKVNVGDKSYLLDASDPLLAFGMLPLKCLNDKGRVFNLEKPSYWIEMNTPQREDDTYTFDLTLLENGKIKGTVTHYSIGYNAYRKRKEIKKFNTTEEYVENLDEKMPKLKILKSEINNLDSLEMPLTEKYDVEIEGFDNMNHEHLTFNPFIWGKITNNPFKLAERDFPVDWGMPSDSRVILTMHLPEKYVIETPPQDQAFALPNKGGKFLMHFESENNLFTFSHITQFSKSVYGPDEYPYLKELYNKIIQSQKAEMVFRKKL